MAKKKPLVLKVTPDIANDPPVKLDDREPQASGRRKIEWCKDKDASVDFNFVAFLPTGGPAQDGETPPRNPFKDISVRKTRIKCDFEPQQAGVKYGYTLAIEVDGVVYTTDQSENPTGGKAVIRN